VKRSIRLSEDLIHEAEMAGDVTKRSIAGQIEYWAEIGRAFEVNNKPTVAELRELSDFNANFMKKISDDVKSGKSREENLKHGYAFESSIMGPDFVDKVFRNGDRITGKVVNGKWTEVGTTRGSK